MSLRPARHRPLLAAVIALGAVLLAAAPAAAHATLSSTEPLGGSALAAAPERVVLRFSEAVQIPLGSIRVFASPSGERVETGPAGRADGDSNAVAVTLPGLDKGNYIVTWRVTSADSHPIHGAFTFTVGSAPRSAEDAALIERLLSAGSGSTTVGAVYAVVRFAAYAALVLLVGGLAFVGLIWPVGAALARARRLLWWAWAVAFVVTAVGIPVQGVYSAALPLSKVFSSTVLSGALDERFGRMWAVRLVLLGLMALVLMAMGRRSPSPTAPAVPRPVLVTGGLVSIGLLLTPGLAGHAATSDLVPLAITSDAIHLVAVSLWLGGLALLLAAVLPRRLAGELSEVVPRFSRLAFWAVITVIVTGTFQGWREVRSTTALTETTYGRLLILKIVLFAVLVGLGGLSRRFVQARYRVPAGSPSTSPSPAAPHGDPSAGVGFGARLSFGPGAATADPDSEVVINLRKTVGAETVIAVVVLAVTALLVNAQPARSALAQPFNTTMRSETVLVDVTIDPAKAGPADLHLYTLSPTGGVQEIEELTANLTLPSDEVGPLSVPVQRAGPGHFSAYDFTIPLRGEWMLEVKVLLSDIDEVTVSTTVPVK